MENKNNTTISEENLENVAGGGLFSSVCYFQPTGRVRTTEIHDGTKKVEAECSSKCVGFDPCQCYTRKQCVGRWHLIDSETRELLPHSSSNHQQKKPSNGYNT